MEVGALMARYGLRAVVALDWEAASQARADGMVIDLNTRHHEPSVVYSEIAGIAEKLRDARVPVVFLKTDSTIRGPIDASLQSILYTCGRSGA